MLKWSIYILYIYYPCVDYLAWDCLTLVPGVSTGRCSLVSQPCVQSTTGPCLPGNTVSYTEAVHNIHTLIISANYITTSYHKEIGHTVSRIHLWSCIMWWTLLELVSVLLWCLLSTHVQVRVKMRLLRNSDNKFPHHSALVFKFRGLLITSGQLYQL